MKWPSIYSLGLIVILSCSPTEAYAQENSISLKAEELARNLAISDNVTNQGVVIGLHLKEDASRINRIVISPGVAVDKAGRLVPVFGKKQFGSYKILVDGQKEITRANVQQECTCPMEWSTGKKAAFAVWVSREKAITVINLKCSAAQTRIHDKNENATLLGTAAFERSGLDKDWDLVSVSNEGRKLTSLSTGRLVVRRPVPDPEGGGRSETMDETVAVIGQVEDRIELLVKNGLELRVRSMNAKPHFLKLVVQDGDFFVEKTGKE